MNNFRRRTGNIRRYETDRRYFQRRREQEERRKPSQTNHSIQSEKLADSSSRLDELLSTERLDNEFEKDIPMHPYRDGEVNVLSMQRPRRISIEEWIYMHPKTVCYAILLVPLALLDLFILLSN